MFQILCMLVIFFVSPLAAIPLKINLCTENNGKGLETDAKIMKQELEILGHCCTIIDIKTEKEKAEEADLNIFFERISSSVAVKAPTNWFIPNPEYYTQPKEMLGQIDLILCRTREVERIFTKLECQTYFLGFTSRDNYDVRFRKNYELLLHMPGASPLKGTTRIVHAWLNHTNFKKLVLIKHIGTTPKAKNIISIRSRVPDFLLAAVQNECGIHLCTSETEGFGHYLMEAMATGAVVVTTDAPPMNEFISDPRCLVAWEGKEKQKLATRYLISEESLEEVINYLCTLPHEELKKIGEANRLSYLERTEAFRVNLAELMKGYE